jgi:hypothetical protein
MIDVPIDASDTLVNRDTDTGVHQRQRRSA